MKKDLIQLKYNSERIRAINVQLAKKNTTLEAELMTQLDSIYNKIVKPEVREFIGLLEKGNK